MNRAPRPEISVVILCYRSGNFARIFHKRVASILRKYGLDYEIILVGNYRPGSRDNTPRVVRKIANSKVRTRLVIKEKLDPKHAMGWDMKSGLETSRGNAIAVIDGDGQMPPEDILRLFETLTKGGFDLCKTRRISRGDGFYRKFISNIYNSVMQILFPGIANDINGKPKIFTRKVYQKLQLESNDWFIDAEIMIKARRYKFKISEIETDFHKNPKRQSFISFKANFEFIRNILRWRIKEFTRY